MDIFRGRAPLRLGLAGGGTDVSPYCDQFGGAVLSATISLYAHTTITPSEDGRIHFVALDQEVHESFSLGATIDEECQLTLHKGVYERVIRDFCGGKPAAVRIATSCDAPAGSGLGSSSTLVVAMLRTFTEMLNYPLGEYDLAHLAYEIERVDVGLHGGRQDQYAAAFGGFNFLEFHKDGHVLVNPLRIKDWVISELESSMVLFFTGKSRSSAAIIEQESRNVRENNATTLDAMHQTKEQAYRMKEALLRGQVQVMGDVMRCAWEHKKNLASGISTSQIDNLYRIAVDKGAFCGKVSGAGGGGFMMFLVDPSRKLEVVKALREAGGGDIRSCHFVPDGAQAWKAI